MLNVIARVGALARDERAQDLTEYGLLAGLIALVAIAAVSGVGTALNAAWGAIVEGVDAVL
jgi:Flp pilus assembly pilin Flp